MVATKDDSVRAAVARDCVGIVARLAGTSAWVQLLPMHGWPPQSEEVLETLQRRDRTTNDVAEVDLQDGYDRAASAMLAPHAIHAEVWLDKQQVFAAEDAEYVGCALSPEEHQELTSTLLETPGRTSQAFSQLREQLTQVGRIEGSNKRPFGLLVGDTVNHEAIASVRENYLNLGMRSMRGVKRHVRNL